MIKNKIADIIGEDYSEDFGSMSIAEYIIELLSGEIKKLIKDSMPYTGTY